MAHATQLMRHECLSSTQFYVHHATRHSTPHVRLTSELFCLQAHLLFARRAAAPSPARPFASGCEGTVLLKDNYVNAAGEDRLLFPPNADGGLFAGWSSRARSP